MEAVRLRVKDVDFEYMEILVRDGKGEKDRRNAAAQLRHSTLGGRLRPADDPRAFGAFGRANDTDLHARAEPGREGRQKPTGRVKETVPTFVIPQKGSFVELMLSTL